jgi:hypothetical protein
VLPYWCRRTKSHTTRIGPTRLAELWQDLMRSSELGFRTTASLRNWAGVALPKVNVLSPTMAYREAGNPEAPVALFLHGNPTSSYI